MSKSTRSDDVKKLVKLIKNIKFAMLTTATSGGSLRSRPMAAQVEDDFNAKVWFFSDDDEAKVHEIKSDKHVNVSFADPHKNDYVSLSGLATVVKDKAKAKALWNPFYKAWFPDGLDDRKLALIRVDVDRAEYWDSPNSKVVQVAGLIKAVVTGKPAKGGENKKVKLKGRSRRSVGHS